VVLGVLVGESYVSRVTGGETGWYRSQFRGVPDLPVPPFGTTLIRRNPFECRRYSLYHLEVRLRCASCSQPSPRLRRGLWSGINIRRCRSEASM